MDTVEDSASAFQSDFLWTLTRQLQNVYVVEVLAIQRWSLRSETDGCTFFFRVFWLRADLLVLSIMASLPGTKALIEALTITIQPSWFSVGVIFVRRNKTHTFKKNSHLSPSVDKLFSKVTGVHWEGFFLLLWDKLYWLLWHGTGCICNQSQHESSP